MALSTLLRPSGLFCARQDSLLFILHSRLSMRFCRITTGAKSNQHYFIVANLSIFLHVYDSFLFIESCSIDFILILKIKVKH